MKSIEINITPEEKSIVKRLSNGEKLETVGADLGYHPSKFAAKMKEIRTKYGAENSLHLVAIFLREGIIS